MPLASSLTSRWITFRHETMGAKRDELLRLVAALSGACKQNKNVLTDGELVDALEKQGRQIARLRKHQNKMKKTKQRINISPPQESHKTAKNLEEHGLVGESKAAEGVVKRRKFPTDTKTKTDPLDYSYERDVSPSIERQQNAKRVCTEEWIASLQSNKKATMNDSNDAEDCYRPTAVAVAVAVKVNEEAVMVSPLQTHQQNHMRQCVSSQLKKTPRAASPFKQLDRAASPNSVDLSASSTSTMASYYDMYDEYAVCPETMQRYTRSALDRTSSFESMDWTPSDDGSSDKSRFRSIADDVEQRSPASRMATYQRSTHAANARLNISEFHSEHCGETHYFADENKSTAESSSRVTSVKQKNNLSVAPSSTAVVMEVLYGIMEHNESFKWLIDPINQARVAKIVEYHLRDQQNDGVSTQAYEDKRFINELRAHLDALIHENLKIKTENVRLMGKSSQSEALDKNVEELERRLAMNEEAVSMQEGYCREAEATHQNELASKSKLVSSLQHDLEKKDFQIVSLVKNGAELPASGDFIRNPEVSRLKNTVMEKNREICRLNFQLSTKQKLVDEIVKKVVQQLETTLSISSGETLSMLANGLHLDMDMFLFRSIAEKQETIDELKAALLSMEREVGGLEARVAKKTRDTLLLKTKYKSMSSRLTDANVNMSRVHAENERLVASLEEKKGKMHDLIEFLEGKEKQVMHLEEQVNLRQTQLEHVMTEYENLQRQQLDKKSMSGYLPHLKPNVHTQ